MRRRAFFLSALTVLICIAIAVAIPLLRSGDKPNQPQGGKVDSPSVKNTETLDELQQMAKTNKQVEEIIANIGEYPDDLLQLAIRNPETVNFLLHYPDKKGSLGAIQLTNAETNGKIPLFLQWDERWGYASYGDNIIALSGCGPTCLSMVIVGLTGNTAANPREVSVFSEANGYAIPNSGTDWGLFTKGAAAYGLAAEELPLWENDIVQEIQHGHPVICCMRPGDFTTTGHFIVIYGYEDDHFLIHDPNSMERSQKMWDYDTLQGQIKNLWAYSKK